MINFQNPLMRFGSGVPAPQAMMLPPSGPGGITSGPGLDPRAAWMSQMAGRGGLFGNLFRKLLAGRASGATGLRGPEPNPFAGLARFSGPFGNGGGPMIPSFGNLFQRMR